MPTLRDSSSKVRMNSSPMILRFCLGLRYARQLGQEALLGLHVYERDVEVAAEGLLNVLAFVLAHEAVVDEDAGELVAHGLVGEQSGYRGVHPAGKPAHHLLVAHLAADALHGLLDDGGRRPGRGDIADLVQEVLQDVLAVDGVAHLRMELHAVQAGPAVLHGGHGHTGTLRRRAEAGRHFHHRVAVAHPAGHLRGQVEEQRAGLADPDGRTPVLRQIGTRHPAAAQLGHELQAVADAKDGDSQFQHPGIEHRCARGR